MSGVYQKEHELYEKSQVILAGNTSREELLEEYSLLAKKFKGLLRKTEKITKISDTLQKRIREEQQKADLLLHNTLPEKVVRDLKVHGKTEPENFQDVTVYLSDVVGFTKLSTTVEPKVLITELNEIFTAFDDIMESHECERIKTIGDAYMAVCGMPEKNQHHAENITKASIDIIKYITERNLYSEIDWQIRVGIHSGPVVGGIVGIRKYIYDIFGDTINTTARMESNSEPMRINISDSSYQLIKDKFAFIKREPLEVKGKGMMNMYFVSS